MATTTRIRGKTELLGADIQNNDVLLIEHDLSGDDVDKKIKFSTLKTKVLSDLVDGTTPSAKATADASGNDIEQTYATKSELSDVSDDIDDIADGTTVVGKATADADGNPIKSTYAKLSGGTFTGDVTVQGDFTVEGTSYETHTEQLFTKKDEIITRDGASTGLASGEYTGLRAKKYDGTNDGRLVFDSTGTARVGDIGDEEPLATREEASNMIDGALLEWDGTNKRIKSSTKSVAVIDDTVSSPTSAYSSQKVDAIHADLENNVYNFTITETKSVTSATASVVLTANSSSNPITLVNGKTNLKLLFTSYCRSTVARSSESATYYPKVRVYTTSSAYSDIPLVVSRNGKLYLIPCHKVNSGINSSGYYWWWNNFTTFECVYLTSQTVYNSSGTSLGSMNVLLIKENPVVLSYASTTTNSYKVYADGLVEQWGTATTEGTSSVSLPINYSWSNSYKIMLTRNMGTAVDSDNKDSRVYNVTTSSFGYFYSYGSMYWYTIGY